MRLLIKVNVQRSRIFLFPGKRYFLAQKPQKRSEWVLFAVFFFSALSEKKKPYNTVEILRLFSVKKIGLMCVWVFRFLNKNTHYINNFVIIFFLIIGNQLYLRYNQIFVQIFLASRTKHWIKYIFPKKTVNLIDFTWFFNGRIRIKPFFPQLWFPSPETSLKSRQFAPAYDFWLFWNKTKYRLQISKIRVFFGSCKVRGVNLRKT